MSDVRPVNHTILSVVPGSRCRWQRHSAWFTPVREVPLPATRSTEMRHHHSFIHIARDSTGTSAIEFAIILPVFLLIAFGIAAYGLYFGAVHSASQLAADAARSSVAGLSTEERIKIASESIKENVSSYPLLRPDRISVDAAPSPSDANQFRVTVRYDAKDLPIWNFATFLPLPSRTIERGAAIKRGGY